jgi:hypothetical protein
MLLIRADLTRALAKAIAYKLAGNDARAREWGEELLKLLKQAEILP